MMYILFQYCIIQDRNRLRNEFIGLKINDVIIKEREKLEQKNGGMDASDLQVCLISSHNKAFYTPRNIFWACLLFTSPNDQLFQVQLDVFDERSVVPVSEHY